MFKNAALKDIAGRVTTHTSCDMVTRYIHEDIEAIKEAAKRYSEAAEAAF